MSEPEKIDLFKQFKSEYKAAKKPAIIEASAAQYLAIDGRGAPGGECFEECIGALYSMAFTVKMTRKVAGRGDYAVCKLEALWCGPDGQCIDGLAPEQWRWTLMIRTPDCVGREDLDKAAEALLSRGKAEIVKAVRLETLHEGRCVQMLHVGPYDRLGQSYQQMADAAGAQGLKAAGRAHDIYLSDPRRVEPEQLKTIIRLPVK